MSEVVRLDQWKPDDVVFARMLEARAETAGDDTFFDFAGRSWGVREFNAYANRIAHNLVRSGVTSGTVVGVLMNTSPDYLGLWFALAKIGAVEVPINTAYRGELLRHQLATSHASVCIVDLEFAAEVEQVRRALPDLARVVVRGADGGPVIGAEDFGDLLVPAPEHDLVESPDYDDIAGIIFTSGTTGPSKGVLLSHYYVTAYGLMYAEINRLRQDDVIFNFLPYFHMAAKFLTIATLASGGRMLLSPRLSISTFLDDVKTHGVTNFVGVGGICNMLLATPEAPTDRDLPIRTIYAVPDPAEMHDDLERRFNCHITTVYGSTEAGLPIFRTVDDEYRAGSCGHASPYYEVALLDDRDQPVADGETGNFAVRPRLPYLVASGYIGMPERTVEAWRNLWLHTGDRGMRDPEGWYYFQDRATDSIRRRGENISSYEVENLVTTHPAVAEAVAVAEPSEMGEDEVRVLVRLLPGSAPTEAELFEHCAACMPYFMVPRYIDIVDDYPRTPTAKVEKYKIRAAGLSENTWDREQHGYRMTRDGLTFRGGA